MKERPILFSGEMVRAILDGRKTQTRRVCKVQPKGSNYLRASDAGIDGFGDIGRFVVSSHYGNALQTVECPYGQPGDRLWVRETWGAHWMYDDIPPRGIIKYYSPDERPSAGLSYRANWTDAMPANVKKWRPSIHMPRWASRITLKGVAVRVERLQNISDDDAKAEGAFFKDYGRRCFHQKGPAKDVGDCPAPDDTHPQREGWSMVPTERSEQCLGGPRWAFANYWNKLNAKRGHDWGTNPWVWVVEFRKL